jgi:glycosyltransferase involved in cell wall biosynthesis
MAGARVAVVHDWLYTVGGAERVLQAILRCFPQADLHCLFDLMDAAGRREIGYERSVTSFLQRMPFLRRRHRLYLPLMPLAIEQLDLRGYDLVISSSYAVAKGVLTGPDQLHISYVHSPMRYAWDLQSEYLQESRLRSGVKSWMARLLLHKMRLWDVRTVAGVDQYVANSRFVARRIRKLYGRQATVIFPPVRVPETLAHTAKERFFLTASRLVPYKNVRVIVEAFSQLLPQERLLVAGEGPEAARLRALAGPNVELVGRVSDARLRELMAKAAAFVFAAEEDFGIILVEAQAAGTPVIALGRGGARESVVTEGASPTGLFFDAPNPGSVADAVRRFLADPIRFTPVACHANARRFDEARFAREFGDLVADAYARFVTERDWTIAGPAAGAVNVAAE